jgi:hypothetical protein
MTDVGKVWAIWSKLYCHFVYFKAIWYILVYFCPVLVCCAEKNLATLLVGSGQRGVTHSQCDPIR